MRKRLIYIILIFFILGANVSCSTDKPNDESILTLEKSFTNDFDRWLEENLVRQYNIRYMYKMQDIESSQSYWLVPADYDKAVQFAKIIKHALLGPYDEIVGSLFLKQYFPKLIHIIGNAAYNNNNTRILGTAEGGMKITLYEINGTDFDSWAQLTEQFHTCHHEFAHILHQTKMFNTDYRELTGEHYIGDNWSNTSYQEALDLGFISTYSRKEYTEDFVEVYAYYITWTQDEWDNYVGRASQDGRNIIDQKVEIVKDYFLNTWGIDLDKMRELVQRRMSEIPQLDLDKL